MTIRSVYASGVPAQLLRQLRDSEVRCPAGDLRGDCGVLCAIEAHVIDGHADPITVGVFCTGAYTACTTWQAEKTRLEQGRPSFTELAAQVRRMAFEQRQVKEQRFAAARERIFSNTPEGRRLRRMLRIDESVTETDLIGAAA